MRNKFRIALTLSFSDWGILITAWFRLLYIDLLLRCLPYPRVQQFVNKQHQNKHVIATGQAWEIIRRYQRFVLLAARYHLYQMGCLRQALTMKMLLGKQGLITVLRLGVRKESNQILAHAWLDYEKQSIELAHDGKKNYEQLTSLAEK